MCAAFDGKTLAQKFLAMHPELVDLAPKDPAPKGKTFKNKSAVFGGKTLAQKFLAMHPELVDPVPKDPAPKGKTFEKIGEVFDSGCPAWKNVPEDSRLDKVQKEIEMGNLKTVAPRVGGGGARGAKGSFLESHQQKPEIQGQVAGKPTVAADSLAKSRMKKSVSRIEPPLTTKAGLPLTMDAFRDSLKGAISTLHEDHEYFTKASCPLPMEILPVTDVVLVPSK